MILHCARCGHEWEFTIRLPMALSRALVVMQGVVAAGCPLCGAHGNQVLVGPKTP